MSVFPITLATPASSPRTPPRDSEVVVIGGGVIGVCTALYLARAGRRVTLLEKGRVAGEQSSRNWGWIRQQGRDPAVAIPAEPFSQGDDGRCQHILVLAWHTRLALGGTVLADHAAGPALGCAECLHHMIDRLALA